MKMRRNNEDPGSTWRSKLCRGRSVLFESLEARRFLAVDLVTREITLPYPRSDVAATAVDGLVLFAGCDTLNSQGVSYSSEVDIYNTATGTWSTSQLSAARSGIAATTIGDLAIFAGGQNAGGDTSTVDVYDAQTGAWTTWQMPKAYTGLAATSAGTKVFLAGGGSPSAGSIGGDSEDIPIYDTSAGDWVTAALSTPRDQLAATTVDDLVMFAGGGHLYNVTDSAAMSDSVDIYDTTTDQ